MSQLCSLVMIYALNPQMLPPAAMFELGDLELLSITVCVMIEPWLCCAAIFSLLRLWIWSSKRRNDGRIKMIKTYDGDSPVYSDPREGFLGKEKKKKKQVLRSKEKHLWVLDGRRERPSFHLGAFQWGQGSGGSGLGDKTEWTLRLTSDKDRLPHWLISHCFLGNP